MGSGDPCDLKPLMQATSSPVIAFGGSYGGMVYWKSHCDKCGIIMSDQLTCRDASSVASHEVPQCCARVRTVSSSLHLIGVYLLHIRTVSSSLRAIAASAPIWLFPGISPCTVRQKQHFIA